MIRARGSGQDQNRGTPPPVLRFSAHGQNMFKSVPVVITNTVQDFENSIDYIEAPVNGGSGTLSEMTRVPTMMTINVTLAPVVSRSAQQRFSLERYAKGHLVGHSRDIGGTP